MYNLTPTIHRPDGQYTKLESEPMPQLTKENCELYNSFIDNAISDIDINIHSTTSKQSIESSVSQNVDTFSAGSRHADSGSHHADSASNVPQKTHDSSSSQKATLSSETNPTPNKLLADIGIINSLTHSGITDQQAMPLSRNRPASERGRRRKEIEVARYARIPAEEESQAVEPPKQCVRRRPKSDRYVRHKNTAPPEDR